MRHHAGCVLHALRPVRPLAVPPDLHLDPAVLRAVAATVEGLLPALRVPGPDPVDLDALARAPGGAALPAEYDRLTAAVARVDRELAERAAGLGVVADDVASADAAAARSLVLW